MLCFIVVTGNIKFVVFSDFDDRLNRLNVMNNPGMLWVFILDDDKYSVSIASDYKISQHRIIYIKNNPGFVLFIQFT